MSFDLKFVIDDNGTGQGTIAELNEDNNTFSITSNLLVSDTLKTLDNIESCNLGLGKGIFNFSSYEELIKVNPLDIVTFYPTQTDLYNNTNAITNLSSYPTTSSPTTIYVKVDNGTCFNTTTFNLTTKTVYQ